MLPFSHFSAWGWIIAAVAAFFVGLTKAGFNGSGLITVLLMAEIMPAKESTGVVLPMLIAADLMAIAAYRRHVVWKDLWKLLPTTFLGLIAGYLLMERIPDRVYGRFLGWSLLSMMALVLWQRFDRRVLSGIMHHPALSSISGMLAGVTTMMANAGGPVMTFYLLAKKFDKMSFVGTCAWFFFLSNLAKAPLSWSLGLITRESLLVNLVLMPGVIIGLLLGRALIEMIPQVPFEWVLLLTAIASSMRMIMG